MEPLTILQAIRKELKSVLVERDHLVDGVLLALLARQHVLLLGPPGTAKSMLARELCRRLGGRYFEWLLTKFTTPEEIFGPLSLPALEQGRFERIIENKLPVADIAFLDEIFKANSAILNSLLTILNERRFYQGTQIMDVPVHSVIGASNELPEEEELAALYDRFALRFTAGYIENAGNFGRMLLMHDAGKAPVTVLPRESLMTLAQACAAIAVPKAVIAEMAQLRQQLTTKGVIASDRRYRQSLSVLRAAALLDGRQSVQHQDLFWLEHMLWNDPSEQSAVLAVLSEMSSGFEEEARKLIRQALEIKAYAARSWPTQAESDRALIEAHTKLEDIHRHLGTLQRRARERGRDAGPLEHHKQRVADMQRELLVSARSWVS
ncbi:MAG: AAA domain-containing protein [Gammaproteobacteria bacterium]|nr:AAA domain-containing protein [Gammaproteobacteria bacterium]